MVLIGAGRYHTAMCTSSQLYTVGKNLGQLGYEKTYETQISPHTVKLLHILSAFFVECDNYVVMYIH